VKSSSPSSSRPDPLRIVEAAYTWEDTEAAWLSNVTEAAAPWSAGGGVVACALHCAPSAKARVTSAHITAGASTDDTEVIRTVAEALPPALATTLFAPTEFVGNTRWRMERIAKESKLDPRKLAGGKPLPAMWAVVAGAPRERAVILAFPAPLATKASFSSTDPFPSGDSKTLGLVAAHLGAALRLRVLGKSDANNAETTEAVLTPKGKLLHANGEVARSTRIRESLTEAVLRSEKARGRLRKVDSDEATRLWSALVEGRWSIVEATERDGKRFLLARRNTLETPDLIALTKAENDVVWLAAHGHSHKYIAYELGLSVPAVTRRLKSALAKLRIPSRRDLLRKLGAVVQEH